MPVARCRTQRLATKKPAHTTGKKVTLRSRLQTHAGQQLYQTVGSVDSTDLGTSPYGLLLQLREASTEAEGYLSFIRKSVDIIANTREYIVRSALTTADDCHDSMIGTDRTRRCVIKPAIILY